MNNYRYLSEELLISQEKKKKHHLIAGWIVTGFLIFGVVDDLTVSVSKVIENISIYLIFLIPGVVLL